MVQGIAMDAELKLRRIETRLGLLRGRVPIYMWACDPNMRITWAWESSYGDLGDEGTALAGADLHTIVAGEPSARRISDEHRRALSGEEVLFTANYRNRLYRVWLIPHVSASGEVLGVSGLAAAVLSNPLDQLFSPDGRFSGDETVIRVHDLAICIDRHEVYRRGELVDLTPTEFRLLVMLARRPGLVLTRGMLLEQVWGFGFDAGGSMISTAVMRLRSKIEADDEHPLIETVRGIGYRMRRTDS